MMRKTPQRRPDPSLSHSTDHVTISHPQQQDPLARSFDIIGEQSAQPEKSSLHFVIANSIADHRKQVLQCPTSNHPSDIMDGYVCMSLGTAFAVAHLD